MSVKVTLPQGCAGFTMQDGTEYKGREGGSVTVAEEHAPFIRRQVGGDAGLVGFSSFRSFMGTKDGRWCPECRFLAQAWSTECPRCARRGAVTLTIPEAEMPEQPRAAWPSGCIPVRAPS